MRPCSVGIPHPNGWNGLLGGRARCCQQAPLVRANRKAIPRGCHFAATMTQPDYLSGMCRFPMRFPVELRWQDVAPAVAAERPGPTHSSRFHHTPGSRARYRAYLVFRMTAELKSTGVVGEAHHCEELVSCYINPFASYCFRDRVGRLIPYTSSSSIADVLAARWLRRLDGLK